MPHVETNGIRMYYEERGGGDPLILIMGIGAAGAVWEKHAACWQANFRCILADNRGAGFTDKPAGAYSTAQMADDYAGLMTALGIGSARIVGCSMGSTIAQQIALRHPRLAKSLVLMCPWARCDRYARDVFAHLAHAKARLRPEEFSVDLQLLIFTKPYWDRDENYREMMEGRRAAAADPFPQPVHGFEGQAAACVDHDTLDQLRRIECPCLVIGGRNDIFTPVWMAEEVASRIPDCNLHLYDGAGHAFHWECIGDFNGRVRDWLLAH